MNALPTANARDLLGEIVTWDLESQEIPLTTVRKALTDAGLPEDSLGDLRCVTAFQRAIKDLRENRAIDKIKTDKKSTIVTFQFTRKTLDEARLALDFAFEAKCALNTNSGNITCPDSPVIEHHARAMFSHALEHRTTADITRLVQRLFETHADLYPINPKKGVAYFVPERFRSFSAQMEDFLSALGGTLLRFPVPTGTEAGNRSVRESVEAGLLSLSQELQSTVDEWTESTRGATMDHAIERWQLIKHKAEAYSEYLGDRQASLLATLAEQRRRLAAKIEEVTALKESAKVSPRGSDGAQQQTLFSAPFQPPYESPEHDGCRLCATLERADLEIPEPETVSMPW